MGPTACTWRWALLVAGRKVQHSGRLARGRVSVEGAPMGLRKRGLGTEMGTVPGKAVSSSVFSLGPKGKFLLSDHAQALWAHSCQCAGQGPRKSGCGACWEAVFSGKDC